MTLSELKALYAAEQSNVIGLENEVKTLQKRVALLDEQAQCDALEAKITLLQTTKATLQNQKVALLLQLGEEPE